MTEDDKAYYVFLSKLNPTVEDIGNHRSKNGELSNAQVEARARRTCLERALSEEFDETTMTLNERKLHVILQCLMEVGSL